MLRVVEQAMDELRGAWRYRWLAIGIAWAASIVGWLLIYSTQDMYEARARVYVDTRTPLRPLLEGVAAEQDVESQLVMVRQALLGGPHLESVAREAGLIAPDSTEGQRQGLVTTMASRIEIALEPPAVRDPRIPNTFYRIKYADENRETAIKVVDLLLGAFVSDTFGTKRDSAEDAQAFLTGQLRLYRDRLTEAENALAEFKRRNIGMVPGEEGGYFQRLDREEANVQRVEAALRVAGNKRSEISRQMQGEVPFLATSQTPTVRGSSTSMPMDTASRIQETQARLDGLLIHYTERHPDVIAAQQALIELKDRQQREIEAIRRGDPAATAAAGASINPIYQNLQMQLHETDIEIASLRGELRDFQENVSRLRRALNTAPEVEAEYKRLTRDYEVTQSQYNSLLQRFEQARVSEDAQQTGIIDFQIVDPPAASFKPVFPTRPVLAAAVLVLAIGFGVVCAWAMSKLRPVFHNKRALGIATGLPVIGVVSLVWSERQRIANRNDYLRCAAATLLLFATAALVVIAQDQGSRILKGLIS